MEEPPALNYDEIYKALRPDQRERVDQLVDMICRKVEWALGKFTIGVVVGSYGREFSRGLREKLTDAHVGLIAHMVWTRIKCKFQ